MKLQDHPGVIVTGLAGSAASIVGLLGWQAGSRPLVAIAGFLAMACLVGWIVPHMRRSPRVMMSVDDRTTSKTVGPLRSSARPPRSDLRSEPPLNLSDVTARVFEDGQNRWRHVNPAEFEEHRFPDLHRTAFACLGVVELVAPRGVEVAEIVQEWVEYQYRHWVEQYPGAAGEGLKNRYYHRAWKELKTGNIVVGESVPRLVALMESWINRQFFQVT